MTRRIYGFPYFTFVFPFNQHPQFFPSFFYIIMLVYGRKDYTLSLQILYPIYAYLMDTFSGLEISEFSAIKESMSYVLSFFFGLLLIRFQVWCHCNHNFITGDKLTPPIIYFMPLSLVISWYFQHHHSSISILGLGGSLYPCKMHQFWPPFFHQNVSRDASDIFI